MKNESKKKSRSCYGKPCIHCVFNNGTILSEMAREQILWLISAGSLNMVSVNVLYLL